MRSKYQDANSDEDFILHFWAYLSRISIHERFHEAEATASMEFVTLAMLIIDDIFYPIPRLPSLNVLGGAGSYAVLGARIVCGPKRSSDIGWTVHKGSDFPESVKRQIDTWQTSCIFIETPVRLTTRALNVYRQNEIRGRLVSCP